MITIAITWTQYREAAPQVTEANLHREADASDRRQHRRLISTAEGSHEVTAKQQRS